MYLLYPSFFLSPTPCACLRCGGSLLFPRSLSDDLYYTGFGLSPRISFESVYWSHYLRSGCKGRCVKTLESTVRLRAPNI
ncbi:hypothetical protein EDB85DRAFT_2006441 [Lactarius pseudohatsudake]|nr:hypothetical protein EDB85DRAFT_2006441 [Lactarius pseudohatsudake]